MWCLTDLHLSGIQARDVPHAQHAIMRLTGLDKLALADMDTTDEVRYPAILLAAVCQLHKFPFADCLARSFAWKHLTYVIAFLHACG